MKTKLFRVFQMLIVALMFSLSLAGCKKGEDKKPEPTTLSATDIEYNLNGNYETILKGKNLKGLNKGNLSINYLAAVNENNQIKLKKAQAEITRVTGDDKEKVVSFRGLNKFNTGEFSLECVDGSKANFKMYYEDVKLTSDLKEVKALTTNLKISLEISGKEFIQDIISSNLVLDGLFKNMEARVISNSPRNLTLELTGVVKEKTSPQELEMGIIRVKAEAIKDAINDAEVLIKVTNPILSLDEKSLTFKDGLAQIILHTNLFDQNIKPEDFSIDNNKVSLNKVKVVDNNNLNLELAISKANDLMSAAEILSNTTFTYKEEKVSANFKDASFHPVFDFVEEVNDNFLIDLKLLALNGKFKNLKASDLTFDADFKDAEVVKFEVVNETNANLKIKVPTLGQTEETIKKDGIIKINKDAFMTNFNTRNRKEAISERHYSQSEMGKFDWGPIVGDGNRIITQMTAYYENGATETYSLIGGYARNGLIIGGVVHVIQAAEVMLKVLDKMLQLLGVIETPDAVNQRLMAQMSEQLLTLVAEQKALALEINSGLLTETLDEFLLDLANLASYVGRYQAMLNETGIKAPKSNASLEDMKAYLADVKKSGLTQSQTYDHVVAMINHYFTSVVNAVNSPFTDSIFNTYDQLLTNIHNFNTQLPIDQIGFAATIQSVVASSYSVLQVNNLMKDIPSSFEVENDQFIKANKKIDAYYTKANDTIKYYAHPEKELQIINYTFNERILNQLSMPDGIFGIGPLGYMTKKPYQTMVFKAGATNSEGNLFVKKMAGRTVEQELVRAAVYFAEPELDQNGNLQYYEKGHKYQGLMKFKDYKPFYMVYMTSDYFEGEFMLHNENKLEHLSQVMGYDKLHLPIYRNVRAFIAVNARL